MKFNLNCLFIVLLLVSFTYGALSDDNYFYLTLDDVDLFVSTYLELVNETNATATGGPITGSPGIIDQSVYFVESDDHLITPVNTDFMAGPDRSINLWLNFTTELGGHNYFLKQTGDSSAYWQLWNSDVNKIRLRIVQTDGSQCAFTSDDAMVLDDWMMFTFTQNCTSGCNDACYHFFIDGVKVAKTNDQALCSNCNMGTLSGLYIGNTQSTNAPMLGGMDEIGFWNRELETSEILELYNSGSGLQYPYGITPPANDTTPPSITNVFQIPNNLTLLNFLVSGIKINATITDNVKVDNLTVFLNYTLNNSDIFINGTKQDISNVRINYTNATGSNYRFFLDEHDILSATYNLPPAIMESTDHDNDTLSGLNSFLKIEFLNVSNNKSLNFVEMMDLNATANSCIADYYYCNSSYITGNPISDNNCILFFSGVNNRAFNHSHAGEKSKHKIYPLGINATTGKIGNVYVTPLSYILKRGTTCTDIFFYIPIISRTDAVQITNNNGNTYSSQLYTPDSHIHETDGEILMYNICASDNSSNSICSTTITDIIDLPIFPPINVIIFNPVQDGSYNTSLLINHSLSFSQSGQAIISYQYEYDNIDNILDSWTVIDTNIHPANTLLWDISTLINGNYSFRVITTDSLNLTSITTVNLFLINNPLALNTQLLISIDNTLNTISTTSSAILQENIKIVGAIDMIWVIMFVILFFALGLITKIFLFWTISGAGFLLIALNQFQTYLANTTNLFALGSGWTFIFLAIVTMLSALIFQFTNLLEGDENEKKSIYDDFY